MSNNYRVTPCIRGAISKNDIISLCCWASIRLESNRDIGSWESFPVNFRLIMLTDWQFSSQFWSPSLKKKLKGFSDRVDSRQLKEYQKSTATIISRFNDFRCHRTTTKRIRQRRQATSTTRLWLEFNVRPKTKSKGWSKSRRKSPRPSPNCKCSSNNKVITSYWNAKSSKYCFAFVIGSLKPLFLRLWALLWWWKKHCFLLHNAA